MSWEVYDAILNGRMPDEPWSPEGEQVAVDTALGIAQFYEENARRPIKEREREANRALKQNPDDPDAHQAKMEALLEREDVFYLTYDKQPVGLVREKKDLSRVRKSKPHELRLVLYLELIWMWRSGEKPSRTIGYLDGEPTHAFFSWAGKHVRQAGFARDSYSDAWVHRRLTIAYTELGKAEEQRRLDAITSLWSGLITLLRRRATRAKNRR